MTFESLLARLTRPIVLVAVLAIGITVLTATPAEAATAPSTTAATPAATATPATAPTPASAPASPPSSQPPAVVTPVSAPVSTAPASSAPVSTAPAASAARGDPVARLVPPPPGPERMDVRGGKEPRSDKGAAGTQAGATAQPLTYHGGAVQNSPQVYLSFWGPGWGASSQQAAVDYVQSFFGGVGGSPWLALNTEYCSGSVPSPGTTCSGGDVSRISNRSAS